MPADIRTIERRISALEQAAETQHRQTTGINSDELRFDELVALTYRFLPAQDSERVAKILRGELHVIFPPSYRRDLEGMSLEELREHTRLHRCHCERVWFGDRDKALQHPHVVEGWRAVECDDTAACGRSRTVERQRLFATSAYRELEADPHA
jgi:hypothetical protein